MSSPIASIPPFVGVVTYNPMATLRFPLLESTVRSLEVAFPTSRLFLIDNGSSDDSWDAVCELLGDRGIECSECDREHQRGRWHLRRRREEQLDGAERRAWDLLDAPAGNTTPGAGRYRLWHHMFAHLGEHPPFWVWSDDDMLWRPHAEATLRAFYAEPPNLVAILSGLLEPVWHWNTPRETVESSGVKVLVRDSAPGAAWTFPSYHHVPRELIGGVPDLMRFGYDYECCKRIRAQGGRVAQIDLAEHIGWGCSTHGNDATSHPSTRPLDREKWGV